MPMVHCGHGYTHSPCNCGKLPKHDKCDECGGHLTDTKVMVSTRSII